MQIYDIAVPVNGTMRVAGKGTYLRYYAGSAVGGVDPSIIIKAGGYGTTVVLAPGQAVRLPADAKPVDNWQLLNYAGLGAITGQIVIGDGEITDNRINGSVSVSSGTVVISSGTVTATDENKVRVKANAAYTRSLQFPNSASNQTFAMLWNPVGSGKVLVLDSLRAVAYLSGAGSTIATLQTFTATMGGDLTANNSKYVSTASASVAKQYGGFIPNGTSTGNTVGYAVLNVAGSNVLGNDVQLINNAPWVLKAGSGLGIVSSNDAGIVAIMDWYEE